MSARGVHRPATREELADLLARASSDGDGLLVVGGGTHTPPAPAGAPGLRVARLETGALARLVDHTPADLTVTVEGGMPAGDLEALLAEHGQCWPQADIRPGATVGGVLAAGASGRSRLREGPVRDSLLEVVVATGDGRLVTGGGRTVKNVSGFDIPRMMVGSYGTLGVIVQATLKLWPRPAARGWFHLPGPPAELMDRARDLVAHPSRPASVLMSPAGLHVELAGSAADVRAPADAIPVETGPAEPAGPALIAVGVPPPRLGRLIDGLDAEGWPFVAQMGVGTCHVAADGAGRVRAVRAAAENLGGHAVLVRDDLG
ncbi:MAG: FAD-binding protein, partial [Miltoncostaeaceae bacterium]